MAFPTWRGARQPERLASSGTMRATAQSRMPLSSLRIAWQILLLLSSQSLTVGQSTRVAQGHLDAAPRTIRMAMLRLCGVGACSSVQRTAPRSDRKIALGRSREAVQSARDRSPADSSAEVSLLPRPIPVRALRSFFSLCIVEPFRPHKVSLPECSGRTVLRTIIQRRR